MANKGTITSELRVDDRKFTQGMRRASHRIYSFLWYDFCFRNRWPCGIWYVSPPLQDPRKQS